MHERILVPLDGSKLGEAALSCVELVMSKFSPEIKVEIILLRVVPRLVNVVPSGYEIATFPYADGQMEPIKAKALEYLNTVGETLRQKGAIVTCKVTVGDAAEEIIKVAEEAKADFIAMSTHGRSGLGRWAFGSVAEKVLRSGVKVPILMVKATDPGN